MNKPTDHFSLLEIVDIRMAIQNDISKCDTMIADCTHLKLSNDITQVWIDKRERLTKSLDKLTLKSLW